MSADRFGIDASILFYSIDRDAGRRHEIAGRALRRAAIEVDTLITMQAYCELFAAATRKGIVTIPDAKAQIEDWRLLYTTVLPRSSCLSQAIEAVEAHDLSFWDAMLWSASKDAGVTILLSEDLQDGRDLGGVLFRNPFTATDPLAPRH